MEKKRFNKKSAYAIKETQLMRQIYKGRNTNNNSSSIETTLKCQINVGNELKDAFKNHRKFWEYTELSRIWHSPSSICQIGYILFVFQCPRKGGQKNT